MISSKEFIKDKIVGSQAPPPPTPVNHFNKERLLSFSFYWPLQFCVEYTETKYRDDLTLYVMQSNLIKGFQQEKNELIFSIPSSLRSPGPSYY